MPTPTIQCEERRRQSAPALTFALVHPVLASIRWNGRGRLERRPSTDSLRCWKQTAGHAGAWERKADVGRAGYAARELSGVEGHSSSGAGGDASELLRELVSHRLPAAVLREARAAGGGGGGVFVMGIDGSRPVRPGGGGAFPARAG